MPMQAERSELETQRRYEDSFLPTRKISDLDPNENDEMNFSVEEEEEIRTDTLKSIRQMHQQLKLPKDDY